MRQKLTQRINLIFAELFTVVTNQKGIESTVYQYPVN